MSAYSKNQQYVYDAAATRSNQLPGFPGSAQPSFASQYTDAPTQLSHEPSNADMPYISSSTFESRGIEAHQPTASFIDARSRHPASRSATETEITEPVSPTQGIAGSTVSLQLRTNYDLAASQHTFILMFGSKKCAAALQKVDYDDEWYNYVLNVEVPPFPLTNSWDPTMMLKLQIEDRNGQLKSQADAGKFSFTDMSPNLAYQSSPEFSRKRKYSTEFGDAQGFGSAAKRANTMRQYAKPRSISGTYSAAQTSPLPAPSALSGGYSAYDLAKTPSFTPQLSEKGLYAVPSMNLLQGDYKYQQMSPSLQSYGYSGISSGRSPALMSVAPSGGSALPSSTSLPAPVLVRATTLPQASSSTTQSFNPYTMYQTKAVLKIEGELDKMSEEWSQEELDAKRRLVEFKRSQQGSTITTSFAPITPEARAARSICVSCIWWEEKDECFITSVDTIYLLEQLVNVRFTVEEKNRIRRNLEGFRPLTVSKAKADSEEFFKVIMGFPNPKPRNIEKDVKVFPWKIISHALKKIISKYSASYSSTAGIGSLPIASTTPYTPSAMTQAINSVHRQTSPQSGSLSTPTPAYPSSLTSTSSSPHIKVSAGLDGSAGHGLSISQRPPSNQSMTTWGTSHTHQMAYPSSLSQGARGSWNYSYMNAPTTPSLPPAAPSLAIQSSDLPSDASQLPLDVTYSSYGDRTTRV